MVTLVTSGYIGYKWLHWLQVVTLVTSGYIGYKCGYKWLHWLRSLKWLHSCTECHWVITTILSVRMPGSFSVRSGILSVRTLGSLVLERWGSLVLERREPRSLVR